MEGARDGRTVAELMSRGDAPARRGRRDGRRRRADHRSAGRGDLSRRHQAGHRAPADPRAATPIGIGAVTPADGDDRDQRRPRHPPRRRGQHRRPPDPGRLALPLLRGQPGAEFDRAAARGFRLDIAAGTAVRFEPGQTRTVDLVAYDGARVVHGFRGEVMGPLDGAPMKTIDRARLRGDVRPHDRRPRPAGRHRPGHRGRTRPHHLRRGGEVRRRQGDPRRHGAEPARAASRRRRHGDHQRASCSTSAASSRPTSASSTAASAASARPATPTCSPASTS